MIQRQAGHTTKAYVLKTIAAETGWPQTAVEEAWDYLLSRGYFEKTGRSQFVWRGARRGCRKKPTCPAA